MGLLATNTLTLADWAKRLDPGGQVADVIELLGQTNEILTDMMWAEGNLPTGHRTTVRTGLPAVAWRLLNYGVAPTKSSTVQVDDACGMLEAYSEVDKDLALLNGNTAQFRLSEARAFLEAMNQEMAAKLFYGNTAVDPKVPLGLAPRYSSLSAGNGGNIISGAGAGSDNTSMWLICWGDQTCHGIFPKGSKAGLLREDLGEDTVVDAGGGRFQALREHFQWKAGFSLRDWRYVVRIANIDVSNLIAESSNADLIKLMYRALMKLPTPSMGKCAFYANRTVTTMLGIQSLAKSSSAVKVEEALSQISEKFLGVPIRTCDAILTTEATVS